MAWVIPENGENIQRADQRSLNTCKIGRGVPMTGFKTAFDVTLNFKLLLIV